MWRISCLKNGLHEKKLPDFLNFETKRVSLQEMLPSLPIDIHQFQLRNMVSLEGVKVAHVVVRVAYYV